MIGNRGKLEYMPIYENLNAIYLFNNLQTMEINWVQYHPFSLRTSIGIVIDTNKDRKGVG